MVLISCSIFQVGEGSHNLLNDVLTDSHGWKIPTGSSGKGT